MAVRIPSVDGRRAAEFQRELQALSRVWLPRWRGVASDDGDFGFALLHMAARMASHVARRLDKTPERDLAAFFEMLDMPAEFAMPARVPVVFRLRPGQLRVVLAPAGVQVSAQAEGEPLVFETEQALQLTPARLVSLVAADSSKDSIDCPPPSFFSLEQVLPVPVAHAVTASSAQSTVLQLDGSPPLKQGDLVVIVGKDKSQSQPYRVAGPVKQNLLSLADELLRDVEVGDAVIQRLAFHAFAGRNLQRHAVYVGHAELLDLTDDPGSLSEVHVRFEFVSELSGASEPASEPAMEQGSPTPLPTPIAQQLVDHGVEWAVYATNSQANDEEPAWQALQARVAVDDSLILTPTEDPGCGHG